MQTADEITPVPAPSPAPILEEDPLFRLVVSLVGEELERFRGVSLTVAETAKWTKQTALVADGLGFDSLGLLQVSGRINQFFQLHRSGIEDYLLARPTLGEWVGIIEQGQRHFSRALTFQTSGSTGTPKPCEQALAHLDGDAQAIADMLPDFDRVISLVPPHHIYGFIYSVRLPQLSKCPIIDGRTLSPGQMREHLGEGSLVIATPHLWRYVLTSLGQFPVGTMGITSTAPMPPNLATQLRQAGLHRLCEIYGSSETNGIGWRMGDEAFELFPWWTANTRAETLTRDPSENNADVPLVHAFIDHLEFYDDRRFVPTGRRDGAIQIGGINVFPDRIRTLIEAVHGVSEASVRPFVQGSAEQTRLKAFVVPTHCDNTEALEAKIRAELSVVTKPVEQPLHYSFGTALPRNAMGKYIDWPLETHEANSTG